MIIQSNYHMNNPQPKTEKDLFDALEKASIAELETLAVELRENYRKAKLSLHGHRIPKKDILTRIENAAPLYWVLRKRKSRLNAAFKFTPKTIARLLRVNKHLEDSLEKARQEARPIMLEMEKRIKAKDAFLDDYELEMNLAPYVGKPGIYEILEGTTHHTYGDMTRSKHCLQDYYGDNGKEPDSLDLMNWNIDMHPHNKVFENHHICYLMHELYDHTLWSLPDILKIKTIWIDIKICHQHFAHIRQFRKCHPRNQ